jgi:CHASE3 domain sensor protein
MTTTADTSEDRASVLEARRERLTDRAQGLRTRARAGTFDWWMLIVGGVLISLGILVIVLGWLGASNTAVVFEQIPYLISGGLLGLALVFIGVMVYFAYWLTLLVREGREQRRQLATQQQQLLALQEDIAGTLQEIRRDLGSGEPADKRRRAR